MDLGATRVAGAAAGDPAADVAGHHVVRDPDLHDRLRRLRARLLHQRRRPAAAVGAHLLRDPVRHPALHQRRRHADAARLDPAHRHRPAAARASSADAAAASTCSEDERHVHRPPPTSTLDAPRRPPSRSPASAKSYGDVQVVRDLDLDIARRRVLLDARARPGCGKTTTLRMIGGFVDPTDGRRARSHGQDVTDLPPNRRDVNTVFQSYALFDHLSIWDNVAFGLRRRKVGQGRDDAAGRRDARAGAAHRPRQGQAARPLRRPAAAGRARAGAGQPALGPAARRAAGGPRPQAAQGDAGRAQADPARGRHHLRLRHPRPGRGADHVRPDRGDERGHGSTRCGTPEDIYERPATPLRRRLHRHRQPDVRRRTATAASPCPAACCSRPARSTASPTGRRSVSIAVRPEKIWLSDLKPGHGADRRHRQGDRVRRRHHDVPLEIAPGVELVGARAEPRPRARTEDRWVDGERVRIGWHPEHSLVLR